MVAIPNEVAACVEWLIEKGRALGFHTEVGYVSPEDGLVADASWALNPDQKPLITFNVGSDLGNLYSNVIQWTGSSTEPKSWIHVGVLLPGSVKVDFPSLPPRIRIFVFEVVQLTAALEDLVSKAARLLATYAGVEASASPPAVVCAFARSTEGWPKGQPNARLELTADATVSQEGLNIFAAEMEEDEVMETILAPSRKVVPLEITAGDTVFEGALIRLIEADIGHLLFSTEHRNLPFTFRLCLAKIALTGSISLWFDADKSNPTQATVFWGLASAANEAGELRLSGPNGDVASFSIKKSGRPHRST
jgi:hypothetical protein